LKINKRARKKNIEFKKTLQPKETERAVPSDCLLKSEGKLFYHSPSPKEPEKHSRTPRRFGSGLWEGKRQSDVNPNEKATPGGGEPMPRGYGTE